MLLFGLVSVIGGSLIFFLPETLGNKLPETVEEAINIGSPVVQDAEQDSDSAKSSWFFKSISLVLRPEFSNDNELCTEVTKIFSVIL